ncbi:hypothetical protein Scep_003625 [Stephania cephalantha]|uniref:Uncharacterized protein n=1 Tax=Stephania cephalantha TaxID=152367 RepID=A0AAP0KQZ5_9MAGN
MLFLDLEMREFGDSELSIHEKGFQSRNIASDRKIGFRGSNLRDDDATETDGLFADLNRSDGKDLGFGKEISRDDNGRTYGLRWTPSGSRHRHATARGAGGGDGVGSSQLISSPNEPIELLRRDIQEEMQTHILRVMQDHTLTQDQLREVQGQLRCVEQTLMDRLRISFAPTPLIDVPADDSKSDDDLDN